MAAAPGKERGTSMKYRGVIICSLILSGAFAMNPFFARAKAQGTSRGNAVARLVGNWSGESVCVDRERFPACRDEQVVYRLAKSADKPEIVTVTMDKIVNGQPETMAVLDFAYDAQKQTLVNEFTRNGRRGRWEFTVRDDVIEGSLVTLPDKTRARRVKVKRDE
jgi:hypothetical protein